MKQKLLTRIISTFYLLFCMTMVMGQNVVSLSVKPEAQGVRLSWNPIAEADEYIIYQSQSCFGSYKRIAKLPASKTSFRAKGNKYAYYRLHTVSSGHEKVSSVPHSLETEIFGSNTLILSPLDAPESVNEVIGKITQELADGKISQFTSRRQAILIKPGCYDWLSFENGFYMHVAGLGFSPEETSLERVSVNTNWLGGNNATCNFWRTLENVTLLNRSGTFKYGVSQAAPLRRLKIYGKMSLDMGGWASGGYLANSVATDTIGSTSQQQFFLRNNEVNYFWGVNWNLVSVGDKTTFEPIANRTLIDHTPVVYEKPFLYFANGDYRVFVPGRRTDANGTTWSNGKHEAGTTINLDRFYVARADRDNDQTLNKQLAQGKHILFTPGIYCVAHPLIVSRPNTVILGLGLASIQPTAGNNAMEVADVEGVRIAGLIFDAGSGTNATSDTGGSPVLLRVGKPGSTRKLDHNPIVLSDLFFRVGGVDTALPCRADVSLEINAHATIGDHFWIWRADHGQQVAWELNKADYGLVVNADDVTIYGLFAEHYQKYDTYWKGNNGRMYFYQNEKAYDVPTQQDWVSPDGKGWAAYRVSDLVKKHEAWGVGVYSVFINTKDFVVMENAIVTPSEGDITIHYPFTVLLSTKGGIEHIINGVGGPHTNKESERGSRATLPSAFDNVWRGRKNTARTVLVLGDSNGAAAEGWVTQLKKIRPEDTYCNLSIPGNTIGFDNLKRDTLNTLKNLDSYLCRAVREIGMIDRILIWLGTNDCKADFASLQAEVPRNLDKLLCQIKQSAHFSGTEIVFITPPPIADDSLLEPKYHGGKERLERLVPHLEEIVRKHQSFFLNMHDSLAADYSRLNSDGIHLNEEGALKAASVINQYLNKIPG